MSDEIDDLSDISDFEEDVQNTGTPGTPEAPDNIDPDIGDLAWSDEELVEPDVHVELDNIAEPVAPQKKNISKKEKKLLQKYEDLEVDDPDEIEAMVDLMNDRRSLSEKLENDPEFRAKYIAKEKARREKIEQADDADEIINRIKGGYNDSDSDDMSEFTENIDDSDILRELEDLDDIAGSHDRTQVIKPGVYIQHVDKLIINMNF